MDGGKEKGRIRAPKSEKKGELRGANVKVRTDIEGDASCGHEAGQGETVSLTSIRDIIKESMSTAISELENNISKQLADFQCSFQEDIKKQLGEMGTDINQKMEVIAGQLAATSRRLEEAEERIVEVETFGVEAKEVISNMQKTQLALQAKITELEGHSRRNNIRIYGINEGAEGTSMTNFVENLIKTELGASTGLDDLGIERAHRSLGLKPPDNAPPRSTVVRFTRYTTKEKILSAAWKKPITMDGKRVFFDNDYAAGVMEKRKEYRLIKRVLKEKGIRFHTPLAKMRVFLDSGTVTYESADRAAEDLRARGFPIPSSPEGRQRDATQLNSRWETARRTGPGSSQEYQQRVRGKLRGFQRLAEVEAE